MPKTKQVDVYLNGEYSCSYPGTYTKQEAKEAFLKRYENVRFYEVKCEIGYRNC